MKRELFLLFLFALLSSQCGLTNSKKQKKGNVVQPEIEKTQDELLVEGKLRQDSIEKAAFELMQKTALGNLRFGMNKEQVGLANEKRQLLGKYNYNVENSFNGDDKLYAANLSSDGVKAIGYDTDLKNRYLNLHQIIKTKYGEPISRQNYPSIFDVQKTGKYWIDKWELGTKQIYLGIVENNLNNYSVASKIFDKNMEEIELKRLKDLRNKGIIEASEKF